MAVHQPIDRIEDAIVHTVPPLGRNRGERTFDLHPGVHGLVVGAWFAFVAVLIAAFMGPDLIVTAFIIVASVAALFVTPALWARVVPDDGLRRQSWAEFLQEGADCLTGRLTAGQALAQILTLPALLLGLPVAMAVIKAIV